MTEATAKGVITVGHGRGFVIEAGQTRYVITAAHCLPHFPPCASVSYLQGRTYETLPAALGETPAIWAECLFVDPIADIAVLQSPDGQTLSDEAIAYEEFTDGMQALPVGDMPNQARAKLLGLDCHWIGCVAKTFGRGIWISEAGGDIEAGLSGSPILVDDFAVGVLSTAGGRPGSAHTEGGPQARISCHLPAWLWRVVAADAKEHQPQ